jgi:hypothetical protein
MIDVFCCKDIKKMTIVCLFGFFLFNLHQILSNHNKDYSVVKTLGSCPSSLNGGLFSYINDSIIQNNIIPIQQEVAREYGLQVI